MMNRKLVKFRINLPLATEEKTLKEVARRIGVSDKTLSRAENGQSVSKKSMVLIEEFYGSYYQDEATQIFLGEVS